MAHILVVEDDDRLRQAIAFAAHHAGGHRVSQARNGREGIAMHRSDHADLILTDLLMPEMDGLTMIADLLRDDTSAKIVAISGAGSVSGQDYLGQATQLGAARVLTKPFPFSAVNTIIEEVLALRP